MTPPFEEAIADSSVLLSFLRRDAAGRQPGVDSVYGWFVDGHASLLLLDLSIYEVTNVLVRRHGLPGSDAEVVLGSLLLLSDHVLRGDLPLAVRTAAIAAATGLSGYDAAYLAAGERVEAPVLTLDEELAAHGALHVRELASG